MAENMQTEKVKRKGKNDF